MKLWADSSVEDARSREGEIAHGVQHFIEGEKNIEMGNSASFRIQSAINPLYVNIWSSVTLVAC